ncbi:MAG: nicotinate-nucleotide adenylyltransferase [Pyrinomonadaceae bacterium]|nr:nicotinate-nucleotide adenylyltransferase [Pyrinomonadaceae bacterium]
MKRIAFYGGSFDPPHIGHLQISQSLTRIFALESFTFIPAFRAPHKREVQSISAFHRFAMLALATRCEADTKVSTIEVEAPERPFTIETLHSLKLLHADFSIFFVMGADSWMEIDTWRDWKNVLTTVNIIVVTRPGITIETRHIPDEISKRIIDLRGASANRLENSHEQRIYFTDAVQADVSSTEIRALIRKSDAAWKTFVPEEVANYIEKYELYRY